MACPCTSGLNTAFHSTLQARKFEDNGRAKHALLQQYAANQLVVHGRKFYMRLWCLVTRLLPFTLYLFNGGVVIFGTKQHDTVSTQEVSH